MMTMAERLKLMGKEEGLNKGLNQGMLIVAKKLLKEGQSIQWISKITGLSQIKLKTLS